MIELKVVDSWALLAWLLDQSAAQQVESLIQDAETGGLRLVMSWINVGEVYYIAAKRHGRETAERFLERLPSLPIVLVVPSEADILAAARLKGSRRLSYADAFAAVLAINNRAAVITGDPELGALGDILRVDWIGPEPIRPS